MKVYGVVDVYVHIFLTTTLVGGEWSASRPSRYIPGRSPRTHWIGGWVHPGAGLDNVEKRKFFTLPGLELRPLGCPARSQSLYRLRYPIIIIISRSVLPSYRLNSGGGWTSMKRNAVIINIPHYYLGQDLPLFSRLHCQKQNATKRKLHSIAVANASEQKSSLIFTTFWYENRKFYLKGT
jgi:hypothetical protein